jgi:ABC-type amino acid transport substrate-binding protein
MKRFRARGWGVCFWIFVALLMSPLRGDDGLVEVRAEEGVIVVGSAADAFPHSFVDAAGAPQGFAVEVLDAAARAMNLRVRRVSLPNQVIQANFLRGEYDMLECYGQSLVRAEKCDFSVPYNTLDGTIFVRSDAENVRSLRDLEGKTFVLPGLGSIGEDFIKATGLNCQRVNTSSSIDALSLISEGKADATMGARLTVMSLIERYGYTGIRALDAPVAGFDIRHCFAVHKGDAALLAKLNEGLRSSIGRASTSVFISVGSAGISPRFSRVRTFTFSRPLLCRWGSSWRRGRS